LLQYIDSISNVRVRFLNSSKGYFAVFALNSSFVKEQCTYEQTLNHSRIKRFNGQNNME